MEEANQTISPEVKYITLAEWKMLQTLDALPEWSVFDNVGAANPTNTKRYVVYFDTGWKHWLLVEASAFTKLVDQVIVNHRFSNEAELKQEIGLT